MISKIDLESNLIRVHDWIKSADQKVSIFLAFQGIILTILFEHTFYWIRNYLVNLSNVCLILIISGIILVTYSIYKSASAILPRLGNHKGRKSIMYFNDIAAITIDNFREKVKKMDEKEYEQELVDQIHISSKIASRKHRQFRDSIIAFFVGMFLMATAFLIFTI